MEAVQRIEESFPTSQRSLMETAVLDSSPRAPHWAVIVADFEHLFQSTTANRCPDKGPAQTWRHPASPEDCTFLP